MARKFKFLICFCISVFMLVGCAANDISSVTSPSLFANHDFRNFDWGDPDYLVKKEESAMAIYEGESRVMYWSNFMGYDCDVTYCFDENQLNHGYISIDSDENKEDVYAAISKELKSIYGNPVDKENNAMKFVCEDNSTIYLTKDGLRVGVLFTDKSNEL